ncbi:NAD(P)-binding protein [Auriculariales sp. MPI-PUGE-AT-0066]|nr:NAD(P)-binding protein [Auriculariales sp. MPI-PUGE-AT-0066]
MSAIQRAFLSSPKFAVVGASTNKEKWGTKVLRWYVDRQKDVTPIHPTEPELEGIKTITNLNELLDPTTTSLSIITAAPITLQLLKDAKSLNIPALWLQPGTDDDAVRGYISESGLADRVVFGGPCVLVLGDGILKTLSDEKANL